MLSEENNYKGNWYGHQKESVETVFSEDRDYVSHWDSFALITFSMFSSRHIKMWSTLQNDLGVDQSCK